MKDRRMRSIVLIVCKKILGFSIVLSTNKETGELKLAPSRKIKNLYMMGRKYVNA